MAEKACHGFGSTTQVGLTQALACTLITGIMKIVIETNVAAPIRDVWQAFNNPDDIVQWDATNDWHTTWASNDLNIGGKLLQRMETTGGGEGFDVVATYTQIEPDRLIEFRLNDGLIADRMVRLDFMKNNGGVMVRQTFDSESNHPEIYQRSEWQAVLDRFARHVESLVHFQTVPRA